MPWRGWQTEALDTVLFVVSFWPGLVLLWSLGITYRGRRNRWSLVAYYGAGTVIAVGAALLRGRIVWDVLLHSPITFASPDREY